MRNVWHVFTPIYNCRELCYYTAECIVGALLVVLQGMLASGDITAHFFPRLDGLFVRVVILCPKIATYQELHNRVRRSKATHVQRIRTESMRQLTASCARRVEDRMSREILRCEPSYMGALGRRACVSGGSSIQNFTYIRWQQH